MLSDQLSSPYGQYVTRNARIFTSTPTNGNSNLKIELKKFPAGQDYNEYLNQLRSACDQGLTDAFDVVMLEATVLGEFADCLVDLSAWDAKMTDGFATQVIANSYVNKRLVSLPTEVDFGVMFFNNDVLEKYSSGGPPTNFDEIESKSDAVLRAMRAVDNYGFSGFTGQLREYLTAQVAEWLAGYNKSMIVDTKTGLVAIETNSAARVINRVSTWTGINIIDPSDFTLDAAPLYLTPSQIDNLIDLDASLARFVNERSLFLRHWASTYYVLLKNSISFGWGVGPVVGWDASQNVGALGGWGVGVFKYSDNPAAAVKVASWLASNQMQRGAITTDKIKKIPSRTNLYNDKDVCKVLDQDICDLARNVQFAIRPSSLVGRHYANVTKMISSQMATFFLTPETIVEALTQLSIDLHTELGQPRTGGAININPPAPGKTVPSHMQIQLMGLCGVILVSCTVIYLTKRKQIDENIKEAGDKLKVLAQTAKQEVIMKTQKRADLDFGANEFTHLDEEMDEDDKKVGLAKKGAQPGYSAVKEAEKDDFV
ncbi:periplasmic binding protein-like II [Rhizoclosmatium globosum]|uniref:Periplasmic binding protein-like II n=1 Tax=Rhizoclosmatium globosum TaxID=329046 RepID=A0A1Y2BW04_9FUNG|nr:periplasmic binding protein-like II [Rhizoclosmatium globosum]|eukprot:ORY38827.1 periplasmic binding protein-like II [Rhizoclosmatium globosum]